MRRLTMLLVVAVSLLLVIAAVPAAAKKGGGKGPPEPEGQSPGVTCTWQETGTHWDDDSWDPIDNPNPYLKTDDFTFTLTKNQGDACYDILTSQPGRWFITATAVSGAGASSMTIVPRDATTPGDSCGGVTMYRDLYGAPIPLPWFDDVNGNGVQDSGEDGDTRFSEIPASTVNACIGNDESEPIWGQFGEWFDWDGDGEFDSEPVPIGEGYPEALHGEYPLGETVMHPIDYEHPLVLLVFSGGFKKNGATEMCVDLPPTGTGLCYQP